MMKQDAQAWLSQKFNTLSAQNVLDLAYDIEDFLYDTEEIMYLCGIHFEFDSNVENAHKKYKFKIVNNNALSLNKLIELDEFPDQHNRYNVKVKSKVESKVNVSDYNLFNINFSVDNKKYSIDYPTVFKVLKDTILSCLTEKQKNILKKYNISEFVLNTPQQDNEPQ